MERAVAEPEAGGQYIACAVVIEGDVEDITEEQLEAWLDALAECLSDES